MNGKLVKIYKLQKAISKITARSVVKVKDCNFRLLTVQELKAKQDVIKFYNSNVCSRLTAGKKETKTKNKVKKQIRFLNDNLNNLHKDFVKVFPEHVMPYSSFCKLHPFCVVKPDYRQRDTCLCMEHENFSFVLEKLNNLKIVNEKNATELLKKITCEGKLHEKCLERSCKDCKDSCIIINEFEDGPISYAQWKTKSIDVEIKQQMKKCKKTIKEEINLTKR